MWRAWDCYEVLYSLLNMGPAMPKVAGNHKRLSRLFILQYTMWMLRHSCHLPLPASRLYNSHIKCPSPPNITSHPFCSISHISHLYTTQVTLSTSKWKWYLLSFISVRRNCHELKAFWLVLSYFNLDWFSNRLDWSMEYFMLKMSEWFASNGLRAMFSLFGNNISTDRHSVSVCNKGPLCWYGFRSLLPLICFIIEFNAIPICSASRMGKGWSVFYVHRAVMSCTTKLEWLELHCFISLHLIYSVLSMKSTFCTYISTY